MCPDFFFTCILLLKGVQLQDLRQVSDRHHEATSHHYIYIYHIIIIIGCLLTSNSQDILAMGEDLLSQEPSVLEPGMRSVSGFLPILTYRDNNTHNSPKTHPHLYFYSFTAGCPKMVMERERERERKKHIIENIDHVYTHHIWRSTNIVYFPYCFVPLFGLALRSWGVPSPFAVPFWATCSTCRIFATSSQRSPERGCCSWELLGGEGGKRSGGRKIRGRNCGVELVLGMGCIAVGG